MTALVEAEEAHGKARGNEEEAVVEVGARQEARQAAATGTAMDAPACFLEKTWSR